MAGSSEASEASAAEEIAPLNSMTGHLCGTGHHRKLLAAGLPFDVAADELEDVMACYFALFCPLAQV